MDWLVKKRRKLRTSLGEVGVQTRFEWCTVSDVTIIGRSALLDSIGKDVGLPAVEEVTMKAEAGGVTYTSQQRSRGNVID